MICPSFSIKRSILRYYRPTAVNVAAKKLLQDGEYISAIKTAGEGLHVGHDESDEAEGFILAGLAWLFNGSPIEAEWNVSFL